MGYLSYYINMFIIIQMLDLFIVGQRFLPNAAGKRSYIAPILV